ncbi:MAG TPA: hypothetical protein VKG01_12745 [Thermoanaerobaculia bacterium]|nr:hypothetical protein [Thermoanaerobaculia bacterium]
MPEVPENKKPARPSTEEEREIEYLVCRLCNTPCYTFEMDRGRLLEAVCMMCGNEDILLFQMTEEEE